MFRQNYFTVFLTVALLFIATAVVSAQTAPVGGRVEMKGADGKATPVAGALVEVFRTDIKAKFPTDTTDKKGFFKFAGLPLGATFVLSISGPGIAPDIIPNIKAGREDLVINVLPGDGKRWSEEEVRQAITNAAGQTQTAETSAEQKKAQEEYEKKVAEVKAKNAKIEETTKIVNASLQEGGKAYDAKNYDIAIAKFEEGYQADPDFAGTAPVLLNNKALALINRGTESYNKAVKATDEATKSSGREAAKKDFADAVAAADKALEILKTATTTDPNLQKNYDANKYLALNNRKSAYRLMSQTGADREKGKEALAAFQEYLAVETDPAKKAKAQLDLALTLQDSNEFDLAIAEFQKILETDPNNLDALVGIGLSMVNVGYINLDADAAKGKEQLQEAANYLQKFVDLAPDTHRFKKDAAETIASLKEQQKVAPQKGKTTTTTRRKN